MVQTFRILGGWEDHISQFDVCGGQTNSSGRYPSINHMAQCGKMNVFFETENECSIYPIPESTEEEQGEYGTRWI